MNANIKVEGRSAIINGPVQLQGAKVKASDLRAGAALVIAGLMADGITEVTGLEHIDRGYSNLSKNLHGLVRPFGGKINKRRSRTIEKHMRIA